MRGFFNFSNIITLVASCWFSLGLLTTATAADSGDVTGDIESDFMCFPWNSANVTCPGETIAVRADVDGVGNGTDYETMVAFHTVTGSACGHMKTYSDSSRREKVYSYSYIDIDCAGPSSCIYDHSCDRGKFVISFVDMTVPGFDQNNPATWVYKSVRSVRFELTANPYSYRLNAPQSAIHQAKAYKVDGDPLTEPDDSQLIDEGPSSCEVPQPGAFGYALCEFTDINDGIKEIWIRTDMSENELDQFVISMEFPYGPAPGGFLYPQPYGPAPGGFLDPQPFPFFEPGLYGSDVGHWDSLGRYGRWSWPIGRHFGYYHRPQVGWGAPSTFMGRGCGAATGGYCYSTAPQTYSNPWYRRDYRYPRGTLPPWMEHER